MSSSKFEEFLSKVTSKVKSKEAHSMIKKELTNHLHALSQSFLNKSSSKEEADEKAINEMGNPYTIGESLNRLHRPKLDWILIALFVVIAGVSFLPLVGGVPEVIAPSSYFIGRQAIWYTLAVLVIIGFLFFDYRKLKNGWMYFYGIGLVIHLYLHLFGNKVNGAKQWISFYGFTVDGTAITLFLFFLAWASIFNKINEFQSWKKQGLLFFLFWAPIFLYLMVPHFMFSIIYFFCVIAMFVFARVQKKLAIELIATNIVAGIVLFVIVISNISRESHLVAKLLAFINPNADPNGAGYMYVVVKDVLSQAGWFGNGLYNDINNLLPATHTDFAFPYLVYTLGWAFGIALCFILLLFIVRISTNAFKTNDLFGRLLVIGGAALFAVPACWNVLMGFGNFPIMGVSLPFISYGGSMLLFYSAVLGLILNVYRRKDLVEPTIELNR